MAQSPGLWDTTRILEHLGNECVGVQNCLTVESPQATVDAGKSTSIAVRCPPSHPHFTGWDTEQSEHLAASLAPATGGRAVSRPTQGQRNPDAVPTVLVTNHADAPGVITVFLGCAEQAPRTTAVRRHRGAVPSNHGSSAPERK
jgi:hypothetical protein